MFRISHIASHEIGLWFRDRDLRRVLKPGTHWVPARFRDEILVTSTLEPRFVHGYLANLVRHPDLNKLLTTVDLTDEKRALVWIDGRLEAVLGPGVHAFWNTQRKVDVETFEVDEPRFVHPKLDSILTHPDAADHLSVVDVEPHEQLLVSDTGALLQDRGQAGRYAFWKQGARVQWTKIDTREQTIDVQGQEIMTADRVTLRLNAIATYRITDAERHLQTVTNGTQTIYRDVQLSLRAAVGGRTLEQLLEDKNIVCDEVRSAMSARASEIGVTLLTIGIRDLILPGEMKTLLNQVIAAQKQAEANLIRRREETAAARSQANTAKLLADNPVLLKMKELEALQEILKGSNARFVFGGGGGLREQIQSLVRETSP